MRAAGVRRAGGEIELLELPAPRPLRAGEVLIEVRAAGVGNWDEFVRAGGWDTGIRPPMALGVTAAGLVTAVADTADSWLAGRRVTTHSLPLRDQGCWAEQFIAAAADVTPLPPGIPDDVAAALPVPVLTAAQALAALEVRESQTVLVHGAGGVTGGLLVQLAGLTGARVIATAGPASADRIASLGADAVLDYRQPGWPGQARMLTGGGGADAAVSAARGGGHAALTAVRDGGVLATITGGAPAGERGIRVRDVQVAPDGAALRRLTGLLAGGALTVPVAACYPLEQAGAALELARRGTHGVAIVLCPAGPGAPR
ncbi:MAG TPA: NADP-dependent oxidoreductase [Streptosporangiaceae bacterium]|jgi:NADPH:quinone reductase-like Zn-dependent oxidoreductase